MTKKKFIGVTSSVHRGHLMWRCIQFEIWLAGGKACRITTTNPNNYQDCDGFVISGGVDIDPKFYGQENTASINIEPERDVLEKQIIQHALEKGKPLAGICRGTQMINIVLGEHCIRKRVIYMQTSCRQQAFLVSCLTDETSPLPKKVKYPNYSDLGRSLSIASTIKPSTG